MRMSIFSQLSRVSVAVGKKRVPRTYISLRSSFFKMKGTVFSESSSGGGLLRAYTKKYRTTPHNSCRSSPVFGRLPVKGPSSLRCVAAVRRCWCQRKVYTVRMPVRLPWCLHVKSCEVVVVGRAAVAAKSDMRWSRLKNSWLKHSATRKA